MWRLKHLGSLPSRYTLFHQTLRFVFLNLDSFFPQCRSTTWVVFHLVRFIFIYKVEWLNIWWSFWSFTGEFIHLMIIACIAWWFPPFSIPSFHHFSPVVFRRAATERSERLSERLRPHGTYGTWHWSPPSVRLKWRMKMVSIRYPIVNPLIQWLIRSNTFTCYCIVNDYILQKS